MEANFWEATQHALQGDVPIVKKPKLTEALLKKPPFRFLHDVISEVQRNTGFAPGLFTGAETDAKAIQDKEGKLSYLQKIVDYVSTTLSKPVAAKPAKIVAGLEPEATNLFLQMLAMAAIGQQQATSSSMSPVLQAATQPASSAAPIAPDSTALQKHEPPSDPMLDPPLQAGSSRRISADQETPTVLGSQPSSLASTSGVTAEAAAARPVHRPTRSTAQPADTPVAGLTEEVSPSNNHNQLAPPKESLPRQLSGKHTLQQDASPSQLPGPSSAKQETSQEPVSNNQQQQQQQAEGLSVPKAAVHSRPERPTSARRGPPKIPQTGSAGRPQTPSGGIARPGTSSGRPGSALRQPALGAPAVSLTSSNGLPQEAQLQAAAAAAAAPQPSSGRQVITSARPGQLPVVAGARPASAGLKRPASAAGPGPAVTLIEEGDNQDDEADILVVTETMPATASLVGQGAEGQGALVRNILEAEKALQEQVGHDDNAAEQQGTGIVLRRKKRDDSSPSRVGDARAIAEVVQKLCQSTNPLARCVEYLQEDLETMTTEFNFWAEERKRFQDKLMKHQESHVDAASSQTQLADLDGQIEATEQRILSLKKTVLQNDANINKLLHMSVGVV